LPARERADVVVQIFGHHNDLRFRVTSNHRVDLTELAQRLRAAESHRQGGPSGIMLSPRRHAVGNRMLGGDGAVRIDVGRVIQITRDFLSELGGRRVANRPSNGDDSHQASASVD
jgi:hypothetical protein